jgi:hypothetical protein
MRLFFDEIMSALKKNLRNAGVENIYNKKIKRLYEQSEKIISGCKPSMAVKDISVGNIILEKNRDAVRLIDPREAVPYLKKTHAKGNVAIDLAGYYVSIERKETELNKTKFKISLDFIKNDIDKEKKQYIKNGAFSEIFYVFCLCLWYSVYISCRCKYCLSPERRWLYKKMIFRLSKNIGQLENLLKNG